MDHVHLFGKSLLKVLVNQECRGQTAKAGASLGPNNQRGLEANRRCDSSKTISQVLIQNIWHLLNISGVAETSVHW